MQNNILNETLFDRVSFKDIQLNEYEICSKCFDECNFDNCDFTNCIFESCTFRNCSFLNCNLSLIKVARSRFDNITFKKCKMIGINWTTAIWRKSSTKKNPIFTLSFDECVLNFSIFIGLNMTEVKIIKCDAREVYFEDAILEKANFKDTDFTDAVFSGTNLKNADFSEAKNYTINVCFNTVTGAKFSLPEAMSLIYALEIDLIS